MLNLWLLSVVVESFNTTVHYLKKLAVGKLDRGFGYRPELLARFGSFEDVQAFYRRFFSW